MNFPVPALITRNVQNKRPPVLHLRNATAPPAQPMVTLQLPRHEKHFRILARNSMITPSTSPERAVNQIQDAKSSLPRGVQLHRASFGRYIIRLTITTEAGHSRFEGTPRQLLERFVGQFAAV